MSKFFGLSAEDVCPDGVARKVVFCRLENGNFVITLHTIWDPTDEPMVTALGLTPSALNMLLAVIAEFQTKTLLNE